MNFKGPRKINSFKGHRGKVKRKQIYNQKKKKSDVIGDEIRSIEQKRHEFDSSSCQQFRDFPISKKTLQGLEYSNFERPTDIQRESIGLCIRGCDVLGAAKTGSGKTLAFVIPVLECLFRNKWTQLDGLGALIISPTRELAFQTFEVLKKVGKFHDFSAGLVIGGKPLKEEAGRINRTNIVICTPGRLLQHMDETTYFTADNLKILVLDEADRILDLGFAQTMNAIISNLPAERQTLLYSATQTRSIKDLARLSLKDPVLVSVHENAAQSTPEQLEQNYMVCELHEKLSLLWSFLRNHLKAKILVFLTSCKQVKYVYEAFKRLRPGIPLACLHGGLPQLRRVAVYNQFMWKQNACLFATDIAARGLDFPGINWVIQLDCPEDAHTYIHRAGRTARYETDGQALLILLPSEEEGMVKQLQDKKIPIEKIKVNQRKMYSITGKMESNCAADPELKESAQRAFVSYLKSVYLMKNKNVFDVQPLNIEEYSKSLGLAIPPRVRFLKREEKRIAEREQKQQEKSKKSKDNVKAAKVKTKLNSEGDSDDSTSESSEEEDDDDDEEEEEEEASDSEEDVLIPVNKVQKDKIKKGAANGDSSKLTKGTKGVSADDSEESDDSDSEGESEESEESGSSESDSSEGELPKGGNSHGLGFQSGSGSEDDDDDDEGLFKVKKNVNIEKIVGAHKETIEEEEAKKTKKPSKVAQAKKVLKKGLTVNKKVTFDEEGEAVRDRYREAQVESERDHAGGIDIQKAKDWMRQEDMLDKELYRQKIKLRHREERMKRKEENRMKKEQQKQVKAKQREDEEDEVCLPSDEEGEERPDPLSFIPDPDKYYGNQDSDDMSYEESDDDESPSQAKKQRMVANSSDEDEEEEEEMEDSDDGESEEDESDEEAGGTLQTDEMLALQLLKGV